MRTSTLAKEIKKRNPFESPQQEAFLNLMRTSAALAAPFERMFREHGFCGTHFNILRILAGEKAAGVDGLPALEVRDRLITPVPDITRLVDKLVDQGLVQRLRTEEDRRVVLLKLTADGRKLVERLSQPLGEMHRQQLAHMSREELSTLTALLEKARSAPN
jgi:DNA-binding MarR family transcriptional regulator